MSLTALWLGIAYALLAALLLALNLRTPYGRPLKWGIIIVVSAFYIGAYVASQNLRGWAVASDPPDAFRLHWAVIEEPDKAQGKAGRIYILASNPQAGEIRPRLYGLPFSYGLAESVEAALEELANGKPLEARMAYKAATPDEKAATDNTTRGQDRRPDAPDVDTLYMEFTTPLSRALPPKPDISG